MANPVLNAFTVAAFLFMLMGVLKPLDVVLIVAVSFFVTQAAPVFHKH